jgi:hypothetical protein
MDLAAKFRCQSAAGTHQIPLPYDSVKSRYTFDSHDFSTLRESCSGSRKRFFPALREAHAATAVSTSGSRPRPAPTNSTITATATSSIPEMMKASK